MGTLNINPSGFFMRAANPFVIALAGTVNPTMTVVTEEGLGKSKIPDVCNARRIQWCGVADLIEKEDWRSGK